MRMKHRLLTGFGAFAIAAGGAVGAAEAQADTVNQILADQAALGGNTGDSISYRFQDRDFGVLMDSSGANVKSGDPNVAGDAVFQDGDVVRGSFIIEFVDTTDTVGNGGFFGSGDNNYLFGRYSFQIDTLTGPAGSEVQFVADPNDPFGTGDGRMFEFYESDTDPGLDGTTADASNRAGFNLVGGGGHSLWAAAGIVAGDDAWNYTPGSDFPGLDVDDWYTAPQDDILASEAIVLGDPGSGQQLSWIAGFDPSQGLNGHLIDAFDPQWRPATTFDVRGGGNDEIFVSKGAVETRLTVIPTPSAAFVGLIGAGFLGLVRGRRDRQTA